MSGSGRERALSVALFLLVASVIDASVALYFGSLGVSDAVPLLLVSVGAIAVLVSSWFEFGQGPFSRGAVSEGKPRRREMKRAREKIEKKPLISPDLRGAILILSVFLVALGAPYVLTSAPVFPVLRLLYGGMPDQLRGIVGGAWEFLMPLYRLDLVYKYALSQNLAALCSLVSVVLLRRWRRW